MSEPRTRWDSSQSISNKPGLTGVAAKLFLGRLYGDQQRLGAVGSLPHDGETVPDVHHLLRGTTSSERLQRQPMAVSSTSGTHEP